MVRPLRGFFFPERLWNGRQRWTTPVLYVMYSWHTVLRYPKSRLSVSWKCGINWIALKGWCLRGLWDALRYLNQLNVSSSYVQSVMECDWLSKWELETKIRSFTGHWHIGSWIQPLDLETALVSSVILNPDKWLVKTWLELTWAESQRHHLSCVILFNTLPFNNNTMLLQKHFYIVLAKMTVIIKAY